MFVTESDFADAMLILAVCCRLSPKLRLITFELMSNHFHLVVSGDKEEVELFIALLKSRLYRHKWSDDRVVNFKKLTVKLFEVDTLDYFRSTIAYCNRNAFVVNDGVTPFSYPWGANSCYFNPQLRQYYQQCRRSARVTELREVFRGKMSDDARGVYMLGDSVSPYSFCDIATGENAFRDAKHYFYAVSKNVESYKRIAAIISEGVVFTDEDVFNAAKSISSEKYCVKSPSLLPSEAKLELARTLHYEYNASDKQILRMLKLEPAILASMF